MPETYFLLTSRDQRQDNYVFFIEDRHGLHRRSRYDKYACTECGKINENRAIADGIDEDVLIQSHDDLVCSDDGLYLASARFALFLKEAGIAGIELIPLPGESKYEIVNPKLLVPTNREACGSRFGRRCERCGRYREVYGIPEISAMLNPPKTMAIFASDVWLETKLARNTILFCN